jgi:hypothetical protein
MNASPSDLARLEARVAETRAELRRLTEQSAPNVELDAARARFHAARQALLQARGAPASLLAEDTLPARLTGHLFASAGASVERLVAARANRKQVGVCLSGGGTRAASCSMGALRGLRALGLLDDVQYLSTVSGGGWAGSLYMYAPYSDDELLGPVLPDWAISQLTWSSGFAPFNLSALAPHAIGQFCTQMGWESLIEGAISLWYNYGSLSGHAYWPRLIGSQVLEPYGLGDHLDSQGAPTRYYTLDKSWYEIVVGKYNPGLSRGSFYFSNPARPFWAASSTFNAPGIDPTPYPFWQTQFDVGVYPRFPGQGRSGLDLGGGGIDPFTFGSNTPLSTNDGLFTVRTPAAQYALSDAVGSSSDALGVELFARLPDWLQREIGDLTPEYTYWPVMSPSQPAQTYQVSDGAGLDNSAICGLLGWSGADSILSFVNTDVPIVVGGGLPPDDINAVQMDSSIAALFGWIWDGGAYRHVRASDGNAWYVQAFPHESFSDLTSGLAAAIADGGAAVAKVKTRTVDNARFGIAAGRAVSVLFVFNYQAGNFWSQVSYDVYWNLSFQYPLVTFPYFGTVTDLNLSPQAVNLLADLMSWSVTTSAAEVRSMFGAIT